MIGLLLITGAAVFAVAASTLTSISRARVEAMLENTGGFAHSALNRYFHRDAFVQARWRALRALGLAAGTLVLLPSLQDWRITLALVLATYVLLSQLGAAILRTSAEVVAPVLLAVLRPFEMVVVPLVDPIVVLARFLARPLKRSIPSPALAESEVELIVSQGERSGALAHDQSEMIRNVLEFGDTQACDLMVPRTQVRAIELSTPPEVLLQIVVEDEHSRYPVYRSSIDDIVGILHVKDLFLFSAVHPLSELKLDQLLRKPVFVPETQRAASVMQQLRAGGHHMCIVLDEFGGTSGILTLEDLLEEIVGEIQDEHDEEEAPIVKLEDGHFVVDASVPVAELNREIGIELPDREEYNSLGGYIVEEMGRVPTPGTVLEREGHRFVIRNADERHVVRVEIMTQPAQISA